MYETAISNKIFTVLDKNCGFIGTFARDELPIIRKYPASLIINTAPSNESGEHWVALFIDIDKSGFYFDSFGFPPYHKEIIDYIDDCTDCLKYNTVTLQTPNRFSVTCGHYCILFIVFMCRGHQFDELIALFTRNTFLNDILVRKVLRM